MGIAERRSIRSCITRLSRPQKIILGALAFFLIIYNLTPYDSRPRSFFRFQHNVIQDYYQNVHPSDSWLFKPQRYPIDPNNDIAIIVKTGFGTKRRVPAALRALSNESFYADTIVTQDFPLLPDQKNYTFANGKEVPVIDIIGWNLERGALKGLEQQERVMKYANLADAVDGEEWMLADGLGKDMGWELDAMKFLSSLEYAWQTLPKKKWYIMADDDTYIIKSSLNLVLGHLNYAKPQFLGNPVGDYKGRFPHGGSSVVMSGAALSKLYDQHPEVVAEGHQESATAIWGDKLLSTTFMKIGIYLDETYRRLFNGEPPWMTRMWVDRFCLPLVSFHGLGNNDAMVHVGETFKNMTEPVFWRQMGKIYGAPDFSSFIAEPIRTNVDYVGRLDEYSTTVDKITEVDECVKICHEHPVGCLAWAFDPGRQQCHFSQWAILGDHVEGRFSGINGKLAKKLESLCHSPK
ncbi:glycosyltransferase family 31 protein [Annulohypoxylon maeteangense]|uniref:glycosyltransferase family 31 protein n=1 Tax=Annulohypoxylon maeteangense TaxID=1927788 RepID=UPI0020074465|nr:glycosyltransferase family 31 protein [Annulohypoxylon maeteangense]KAI0889435.1 glycosyltransferase family 31 protein [Annulohypoxylon maeteangense]